MAQPGHDLPLGRDLRLGLRDLGLQTTGVESGQHLPAPHVVALLHQRRGNALAVIERQLYLPQVHVPMEREFLGRSVALGEPPRHTGRGTGHGE